MDNKIYITPKADEIDYTDGNLFIEDAFTIVQLKLGWKPIRKIVDDYLKDVDQVEGLEIVKFLLSRLTEDRQSEAFKSIWDDPSYVELEKQKSKLDCIILDLKEQIDFLNFTISGYRERHGVQ